MKHSFFLPSVLMLTWLSWTGCSPNQESEKKGDNPISARVASQLESGHEFYMITSFEGEISRYVRSFDPFLKALLKSNHVNQMVKGIPLDTSAAIQALGLSNIAGVGYSSRELGEYGLFHNRSYLHAVNGRQGILLASGGPARKLDFADRLPHNTWIMYEGELDLKSAWPHVLQAIRDVGGVQLASGLGILLAQPVIKESTLKKPLWGELIEQGDFKVRFAMSAKPSASPVVESQKSQTWRYVLPELQFVLELNGPLNLFRDYLEMNRERITQNAELVLENDGELWRIRAKREIPLGGQQEILIKPIVEIDFTNNLIKAYSSSEYADSLASGVSKPLSKTEDFKRANAFFPAEGNARYYVSKALVSHVVGALKQYVHNLDNRGINDDDIKILAIGLMDMLRQNYTLRSGFAGFVQNQDEGILYLSNTYNSHRSKLLGAFMGDYWSSMLTVGLLGAPMHQELTVEHQVRHQLAEISLALRMYHDVSRKPVTLNELIEKGYLTFEPIKLVFYPHFTFPYNEEWEYKLELFEEGRVIVLNHKGEIYELK